MAFNYYTLKQAAREGSRLGNWYGKSVFAAGTEQLNSLGSDAYYILYDDENRIVARTDSGWKSYGTVSESGSVNECTPAAYITAAEVVEAMNPKRKSYYTKSAKKEENPYAPGYDGAERPMGDVKAEMDIEKMLEHARKMSVESLLDGFLVNTMGTL